MVVVPCQCVCVCDCFGYTGKTKIKKRRCRARKSRKRQRLITSLSRGTRYNDKLGFFPIALERGGMTATVYRVVKTISIPISSYNSRNNNKNNRTVPLVSHVYVCQGITTGEWVSAPPPHDVLCTKKTHRSSRGIA